MKKVTLRIKAKDIEETNYTNSTDCAITRALSDAGYPNLEDAGYYIEDNEHKRVITDEDKKYKKLSNKVLDMYEGRIPIKDFKVTLNLDI